MLLEQLGASWFSLALVVLTGVAGYVAVIALSRFAGVLALVVLFGLQYLVAALRRRDLLRSLVDNPPMLLRGVRGAERLR